MKKAIIFLFLTFVWLVLLFPKDILWQEIRGYIKSTQGIIIDAKKVDIKLYILYDKIVLKKLMFLKSFEIDSFQATYNIFKEPFKVELKGRFEYGNFSGMLDLRSKRGFILFEDKKAIFNSILKSYLRRTKEGYIYEFDI